MSLHDFLIQYLKERPFFLSLIRARELSLYQDYLPFKGLVLDVGCGDGFFASILFTKKVKSEGKIIGLDIKESRMKEARALHIYDEIVEYDGVHMLFSSNSFDTVFSNCVLEHVSELDEVLKETYRVMKKGAAFIAPVMARPWEENLVGSLLFGNSYKTWMRKKQVHVNLNTDKEWDNHFKKAGFKIEKKEGYLSPRACKLMDIAHYVSIPSLISRILFNRWVLFPDITAKLYPLKKIENILSERVEAGKSGAIFYVLKK